MVEIEKQRLWKLATISNSKAAWFDIFRHNLPLFMAIPGDATYMLIDSYWVIIIIHITTILNV